MEKIKLKFYNIERCGYYKYTEDEQYLTNISDTLDDLKDWIQDKTLQETKTTDFLSAKTEKLPVYCVAVQKNANNHYLLVTWNQIESTNGNISSINGNQPVVSAASNLESTSLPDGNIPGFATYFWFIPEDNILATIKFNHIENGHIGMNYLIKGFLSRFSKYTVLVQDLNDRENYEVVGYGSGIQSYDPDLHPYFNSKLKRLAGKIDFIKNSRESIKKMIRKTTISHEIVNEVNLFEKLMNFMGSNQPAVARDTIELKYEMKTKPSSQELEDIITSWQTDHEPTWDDIGFVIGSEPNPFWLSSEVPSKDIEINVIRDNDEFVNYDNLLTALENNIVDFRRVYNGES